MRYPLKANLSASDTWRKQKYLVNSYVYFSSESNNK